MFGEFEVLRWIEEVRPGVEGADILEASPLEARVVITTREGRFEVAVRPDGGCSVTEAWPEVAAKPAPCLHSLLMQIAPSYATWYLEQVALKLEAHVQASDSDSEGDGEEEEAEEEGTGCCR